MPRTSAVRSLFPLQAKRTARMCSWMTSSRRIMRISWGWAEAGWEMEPSTASRSGACRMCRFARSMSPSAAEHNWARLPRQGRSRAASTRSGASCGRRARRTGRRCVARGSKAVEEYLRGDRARAGIAMRREPRKSASSGEKPFALTSGRRPRSVKATMRGACGPCRRTRRSSAAWAAGGKLVRAGDIEHADGCEGIF